MQCQKIPKAMCEIVTSMTEDVKGFVQTRVSYWIKLKAKLLIFQGQLCHENDLVGEFEALSEDFRVSDVSVPTASGTMVRTGMTSGFQAVSSVARLRVLSGLFCFRPTKAIAGITAMLLAMRRCMAELPRRKWSLSKKSRSTRTMIRAWYGRRYCRHFVGRKNEQLLYDL